MKKSMLYMLVQAILLGFVVAELGLARTDFVFWLILFGGNGLGLIAYLSCKDD